MTAQELADKYLQPYRLKDGKIQLKYCVFCKGGEHHDTYTAFLDVGRKHYECMRGHCGASCSLKDLARHFGESLESSVDRVAPQRREYVAPKAQVNLPGNPVIEYWQKRGISKETLDRAKVLSDKNGNIVFPYSFKGKVVLLKYKIPREQRIDPETGKKERKAWMEAGGMPVLWGIDDCDPKLGPLIIVEGEPDRLAVMECGIPNVTSVPDGSKNLDWIELCWEQIEPFESIIIWADCDKAGKDMLDKAATRLGIEKCKYVVSPYKDANEHLMHFSKDVEQAKQSVRDFINNAVPVPISGVIDVGDIEDIDFESLEAVYSGISELDSIIGGFKEGLITIWSGKRNEGKSTVINHLVVAEAVEQGHSVGIYSGETPPRLLWFTMKLPLAGACVEAEKDSIGIIQPHIGEEDSAMIKDWCKGKIFLYDNSKSHTPKEILARFKELAQRYGTKVFVIDNLMTIQFRGAGKDDQMLAHSEFVKDCSNFAKQFGAHVHIVVHPRKTRETDDIITIDDIKGTGDIANAADNVLLVSRASESDEKEGGNTKYQTFIEVAKNRIYGVKDVSIGLHFDPISRRFYRHNWQRSKVYGWKPAMDFSWLGQEEE